MGQLCAVIRRWVSLSVSLLVILAMCELPSPANNQYCLQFDGSDDYVDLGSAANLQFQNEITLEAWICAPAMPDDALWSIVSSQSDVDCSGASIILDGRSNPDDFTACRRHIHFQLGDTTQCSSSWHCTDSNAYVPQDQWVHVAATRRANEPAHIYCNGILQPSSSKAWNGSIVVSAPWSIGRQFDLSRFFKGKISDVRIWNRALSQEEIKDGMCRPLAGSETGLVGCWKIDEGSGSTTADATSQGNTGTLTNGPTWTVSDLYTSIQPDLQIRSSLDTSYIGAGVYGDSSSQTCTQAAAHGAPVVYYVKLVNNRAAYDRFVVTAAGSGDGWSVRYYDETDGGIDITSQIALGWTTDNIAASDSELLRVEVRPSASVETGSVPITVSVTSTSDSARSDNVAAVTTMDPGSDWVQWSAADGGNGHYYRAIYVPGGITWDDAKAAAVTGGGYLAAIHSSAENDFVFNLVSDPKFWHAPDSYNNREGAWIGGSDPNHTSSWQWSNGEPWDYSNWSSGEPNNIGSEDAVIFFGPGNTIQSVWNNVGSAYTAYGFVIERDDSPQSTPFDLSIGQQDVKVTPSSPFTSGTVAHVSADVHNASDVDGTAAVRFTATDGTNALDLGTVTGVSIPAWSSATASVDQNTSGLNGTFTYTATIVDPSAPEASTTNNSASLPGVVITNAIPIYYGYNPNSTGALTMVGFTDNTAYSVVSLDPPATVFTSGVLNKAQGLTVGIPNLRHFKVQADKPMFVYLGYDCCAFGGSFFFPAIDGMNRVGNDYTFLIPVLSGTNEFVIWAYDDADVTIRRPDAANPDNSTIVAGPIHLVKYQRWETTGSPLSSGTLYSVHSEAPSSNLTSSARVALECNTGNGQAAVPSANGRDMGRDFVFKTHSWGGGAIAVFAYDDTDVTCTNVDSGSVLFSTHIAKGQTYYQKSSYRNPYHLTSTGDVAVWAGDTEGGDSIADMGDDITINQGNGGREFYLHSQTQGAKIFCAYDGTVVSVTNVGTGATTTYNRDRDGFIDIDAQQVLHIVATNPVMVQTLGGNGFNDWGNTLNPVFSLDSGCAFPPTADAGPDLDVVTGRTVTFDGTRSSGEIISYQWDFDGDGVPDSTDPIATHVFTTVTEAGNPATVKLTVANGNGCQASDTALVNVREPIPFDLSVDAADISFTPLSPMKPDTGAHFAAVIKNNSDYDGACDVKFGISDGTYTTEIGTVTGVTIPQQSSAVAGFDWNATLAPKSYSIVATIVNTNQVESTTANNTASTPGLVIDGNAPTVSITGGPATDETTSPDVTFTWTGSDDVTPAADLRYSYKMDDGDWSAYAADLSHTYTGLTDGQHVFYVRAMDKAGNESIGTSRAFKVDATAPTVVSTSPAKDATDVATDAVVSATFSEVIDPATLSETTFELADDSGQAVPGAISYDATSRTVTLAPGSALVQGTVYTAVITTGVADEHGNALASNYTWSFTSVAPYVSWVNWRSGTPGTNGYATGVLTFGTTNVTVNYTGEMAFIQTTSGTNYWNPSAPYISAKVANAPPAPGIIALSQAASKTLTFSKPVTDLFFAVVSLNGNGYRFNRDFDILSYGRGYWGNGTLTKQDLGDGMYQLNGSGEPHGVIRFKGTFSDITWTSLTNEYWNGFTVGTYGAIIDITPPDTTITSGPGEGSIICENTAAFGLSGTDDISQPGQLKYQWRLDGGTWSDFSADTTVTLSDLVEGSYTFEAAAKDQQDNVDLTPVVRHFAVSLNPPVIRAVNAAPSYRSAVVTWTTDKPSTSQALYGATSGLGQSTPNDALLVTNHSVTISGLSVGKTYHFTVQSSDACGRVSASADAIFGTLADADAPDTQIVSGPAENGTVCSDAAAFTLAGTDDTSLPSEIQFSWRIDGGTWSDFSAATDVNVTGLAAGSHTFEAKAEDAFSKIDPTPAVRHFTVDLDPPVISGVTCTASQLQAAVSWITDADTTSQIEFGKDVNYGSSTALDARTVTVHNVTLIGLDANSTYHYRVKSRDTCGRETVSADMTFTTSSDSAAPDTQIISGPSEGSTFCDNAANFGVTGSDDTTPVAQLQYRWRIDSGAWSAFASATTISVFGLTQGSHTFEAAAEDAYGKIDSTPAARHFSVDLNPPVISAISVSPSQAQVTVTWTTDEPTTSLVEYGSDASYGSETPLNGQFVTSNGVTITGLSPNTPYHFRVHSKDNCGRESVSPDGTFSTLVDDGTPETTITNGPQEGGSSCSTTVSISWTGSDNATPVENLVYSWRIDSSSWSDYTAETSHTFTGLSEASHTFFVRAKDTTGNVDATPALLHFTVDLSSPTISSITSVPQATQAVISWQTSKPANSVVEYGATSSYGSTSSPNENLVTAHNIAITGLTPETPYHYRVRSKDACGREAVSEDHTVTTTADSNAPNTLISSGPSEGGKACGTTVKLCWTGADDATSVDQLVYSYKLDSADWSDWTSETCHEFTGLADGLHTLNVRSKDTVGNIDATPAVRNFVVDTVPPNVSNVVLGPHQSSVTVSWVTNELATSQVEYGTGESFGSQTSVDSNMVSSHKMTITGLTPKTTYYVRVRSNDGCSETVSDAQTVTTTEVLPPNLSPQMMTTPMSTSSGQELQISWTVKNVGLGDAPNGWLDGFYLSDKETWDSSAIPLGQFSNPANLAGLFSYTNTQNLKMPIVAPGLHYIILKTDDANSVSETSEDDNVYVQAINFTMPKQLSISPDRVQLVLNVGASATGQIDISNMGTTALTGLTATVDGASSNFDVQIDPPTAIEALTAKKLSYTVTAKDESTLQCTPTVTIKSAEGVSVPLALYLYVIPRQPVIVADPGRLETSMVRGKQTTVECEISNTGAVAANDLQVNLPDVSWMSLISPKSIGTLGPGEKTKISLLLKPDAALPLGPYDGNFAVAGSNGGVSVGFRFNAISDQFGSLKVTATDEFTFFADDHPNVADATVTLKDAVDGHVVFESMVDDNGEVLKDGLPEGHYNLEVKAYKHATDQEPVQIVAGQVTEIKAFLRRQLVSYTWNVEPVQIEDKYKINLEATFETHVPAPVVTVDPPFAMLPVLEGRTTEIDYTVTNHGLIAAQGVTLDFNDSSEFYIVPLIRDIGTLPAESSIVVPVLVRAKSDGPIQGLPSVATDTVAAKAAALKEAAVKASAVKTLDDDDPNKPCDLIIQGKVIYYYKCVNDVLVAVPIDTTPIKIGKEIWDIVKCGLDLAACAGSLALGPEGAPIAADKCPDAIRCLFKYTCEIISANTGTPCCFCKMVSALLGDTGEMGDAFNCLPKPSLSNSQPVKDLPGQIGIGLNLPSGGIAVNMTPWDFGQGVPGKCQPGFGPAPTSLSNMVSSAGVSSAKSLSSTKSKSTDISKYGGKEVRYRLRCY